jgi:tetratricopeptide (TPR) repeat protein
VQRRATSWSWKKDSRVRRRAELPGLKGGDSLGKTEYAEARQLMERMAQMTSRHRSPYFHAASLITLVQLDIITGIHDAVTLRNLTASKELATELPFHSVTWICDLSQAELDLHNGDQMKAYTTFRIHGGRTESTHHVVYLSLAYLGELSNNLGGLERTAHWATTYFAYSWNRKDLGHTYQALRYLGDILLAQGDERTAMNIFLAVLDASTEMDVHRRRADCMSRIGDILVHRGELAKAKDMWEAALPLFVRSSQAKDAAAIEVKLAHLTSGNADSQPEVTRATQNSTESLGENVSSEGPNGTPSDDLDLAAPTGQPLAVARTGTASTSSKKDTVSISV